jgi:hypothetical protein
MSTARSLLFTDKLREILKAGEPHSDNPSTKVKVKVPRNRHEGPEGGGRGIALLFLDHGTRRDGWSAPRPGHFIPGQDPVPIV